MLSKKRYWRGALIIIFIIILGCATTPEPTQPIITDKIFSAPKSKVWEATMAALTEMGATIRTIDKDSGIITTQEVGFPTERIRELARVTPPHGILGTIWYETNYQMNIYEKSSASNQTQVKVTTKIRAKSKGWFDFDSNGNLERTLFDKIQKNL